MPSAQQILDQVPPQWQRELYQFADSGEASDAFLDFLESDANCQLACDLLMGSDGLIRSVAEAVRWASEPENAELLVIGRAPIFKDTQS